MVGTSSPPIERHDLKTRGHFCRSLLHQHISILKRGHRAEVAREHNHSAYIACHGATLAEMAQAVPDSLDALGQISSVGARNLEAYEREIMRVLGG